MTKVKNQSITKLFWRYVLPTTAALIISGLYQIINGLFVSNFVGSDGLAAINMGWPPIVVVAGMGLMIAVGVGTRYSVESGRKNYKLANRYLAQLFWLIIAMSIVTIAIFYPLATQFLLVQDATPELVKMGNDFLKPMVLGAPIVMSAIGLPLVVRNLGAPILATCTVVLGAITNIFLDYLFIYKLEMGLSGAAYATLLGEALSMIICATFIVKKMIKSGFTLSDFIPSFTIWPNVYKLGVSSMIMYSYVGIIVMLFNKLFMLHGGADYVAAFSIVGYLTGLYYMIVEGVSNGMQPLTSYFYGAREYEKMKYVLKLSLITILVISSTFMLGLMTVPHVVVNLFGDKDLILITSFGIRITFMVVILDGFIVLMGIFFQSVGSARQAILISVSNLLLKVPIAITLPNIFGVKGIWFTTPIANIVLTLFIIVLIRAELKRFRLLQLRTERKKRDQK